MRPRSGLALKHAVTVNFGTIDPGYRGEIRVVMFNLGRAEYVVEKGDRIAQLIVAPYDAVRMARKAIWPIQRAAPAALAPPAGNPASRSTPLNPALP